MTDGEVVRAGFRGPATPCTAVPARTRGAAHKHSSASGTPLHKHRILLPAETTGVVPATAGAFLAPYQSSRPMKVQI